MVETHDNPPPRRPPGRTARRLRRYALINTILIALVYAFSCVALVKYSFQNKTQAGTITLGYGYLMVNYIDLTDPGTTARIREGWRFWWRARWPILTPAYHHRRATTLLVLPLWIPLVAGIVPAVVLFALRRRTRPGHCPSCGYDLTGNVTGVCPECGRAMAEGA